MKRFGVALAVASIWALLLAAPALAGYAVNPGVGSHGRTITGTNWCPNSTVTIFVDGNEVGTAQTDGNGSFSFVLPNTVPNGTHTVTVEGLKSDCSTPFTGQTTVVLGAAGGTAFTGANVTVGALVLGALIVVGLGAMIAGRRRRVGTPE